MTHGSASEETPLVWWVAHLTDAFVYMRMFHARVCVMEAECRRNGKLEVAMCYLMTQVWGLSVGQTGLSSSGDKTLLGCHCFWSLINLPCRRLNSSLFHLCAVCGVWLMKMGRCTRMIPGPCWLSRLVKQGLESETWAVWACLPFSWCVCVCFVSGCFLQRVCPLQLMADCFPIVNQRLIKDHSFK